MLDSLATVCPRKTVRSLLHDVFLWSTTEDELASFFSRNNVTNLLNSKCLRTLCQRSNHVIMQGGHAYLRHCLRVLLRTLRVICERCSFAFSQFLIWRKRVCSFRTWEDCAYTQSIYLTDDLFLRINRSLNPGAEFLDINTSSVREEADLPSSNDFSILNALGSEVDAQDLSFQGIKRKLGLHQETLTRALRRLQRDGYIEHFDHTYRISPKGLETITMSNGIKGSDPTLPSTAVTPILQAMLPTDVNVGELANSLSYKWFGNLRWLGSMRTLDATTLTWIVNDTMQKITCKISRNSLTIGTTAGNNFSTSRIVPSVYEIFDQVWKSLKTMNRNAVPERYIRAS